MLSKLHNCNLVFWSVKMRGLDKKIDVVFFLFLNLNNNYKYNKQTCSFKKKKGYLANSHGSLEISTQYRKG